MWFIGLLLVCLFIVWRGLTKIPVIGKWIKATGEIVVFLVAVTILVMFGTLVWGLMHLGDQMIENKAHPAEQRREFQWPAPRNDREGYQPE